MASKDPLATPLSQLPKPVQQLKSEQPFVQKPSYQALMEEARNTHAEAAAVEMEVAEEPEEMPVYHTMEVPPSPSPPPSPPPRPVYVMPPPPPAASKAASMLSVEANKHLIVLIAITALALQFLAPKMRTYARFQSNTGIGMSIVGVVVLSVVIALSYKIITYAAGMSST